MDRGLVKTERSPHFTCFRSGAPAGAGGSDNGGRSPSYPIDNVGRSPTYPAARDMNVAARADSHVAARTTRRLAPAGLTMSGRAQPTPLTTLGGARPTRRRAGVVAVQVVVLMTALVGMAALTVDMGYLWNVRADLQRTADAAALAAASRLSEVDPSAGSARQTAQYYADRNKVFDQAVALSADDVTLGRATLVNGRYEFTPAGAEDFPDAVRVRVETTEDLYFGRIFGLSEKTLSAEATALLVPRDIAIVADLSASHNDDSELGSYLDTNINIWDVWASLPGGSDSTESTWTPESLAGLDLDEHGFNIQSAGPAYGLFRDLKYGTEVVDENYDPRDDPGLIYLPRFGMGRSDWNSPVLINYLAGLRFDNDARYSGAELNQIRNTAQHANGYRWARQVAVALGLARWDSGKPGGAWETIGGAIHGNGDDRVDASELTWLEPYFDEPGEKWLEYIIWDQSWGARMVLTNRNFRYAYGVKTFTDYLMEYRFTHDQTPELAMTPEQPMQAVKDAVEIMVELVDSFDNADQLSLEVYGTTARHRVPLLKRPNLFEVSTGSDGLSNMQAGYFDGWTNMGGGIQKGIETLTHSPARDSADKMIVLLTDGQANINEDGEWPHGTQADSQRILQEAKDYVLDQARSAEKHGIRIFAISVGAYADTELMQKIADITHGEHFQAISNDIATYQAQLQDIFIRLGANRSVELIN